MRDIPNNDRLELRANDKLLIQISIRTIFSNLTVMLPSEHSRRPPVFTVDNPREGLTAASRFIEKSSHPLKIDAVHK